MFLGSFSFSLLVVRISGFSSLFSVIAVFLCPPTTAEKTAIAGKIKKKTEILTS